MEYVSSALYSLGPFAVATLLLFFTAMGKRLGEALELPPYYRLYFLAAVCFLLPLPVSWLLLLLKAWGLPQPNPKTGLVIKVLVASIPMGIAISLAVYPTAKYWGWIWGELRGPGKDNGRQDAS